MFRLLADENFDNDILRGLAPRAPKMDLVRAQDLGLMSTPDPDVLEWAAQENRIVLSHDKRTMPGFAYARIRLDLSMAGVFVVRRSLSVGLAIDELAMTFGASKPDEWRDQVVFIPL